MRAVSPMVSTLLLVGLAVTIATIFYFQIQGTIGGVSSKIEAAKSVSIPVRVDYAELTTPYTWRVIIYNPRSTEVNLFHVKTFVLKGKKICAVSKGFVADKNSIPAYSSLSVLFYGWNSCDIDNGPWTLRILDDSGATFDVPLRFSRERMNLRLWFTFDENSNTIIDHSGNGNNGTLEGTATYTSNSVHGLALNLDDNDAYVVIPNSPSLNPTEAITVIGFFYIAENPDCNTDSSSINWRSVLHKGSTANTGSGYDIVLQPEDGNKLRWDIGADDSLRYGSGATDFSVGSWYNITLMYNSEINEGKIYVNTVDVSTLMRSGGGEIHPNTEPLYLSINSAQCPDGDGYFPGYIDELMIFGRPLTEEEIKAIYLLGLG